MKCKRTAVASVLLLLGAWGLPASAEVERGEAQCGAFTREASGVDSGPFDYRHPPAEKKLVVETHHFTRQVELLQKGLSTAYIGGDIDFTLRYFPNHLRALLSMAELARREKTNRPRGSHLTIDCWFDRAVRFAPTDTPVRLAYGDWLAKKGERALALEHLDWVSEHVEDSPMLWYNLGLAYCEAGQYDSALRFAHRAYATGYSLPGLRNRLVRAGKWREATAEELAAITAPSAPDAKKGDAPAAPEAAVEAKDSEAAGPSKSGQ